MLVFPDMTLPPMTIYLGLIDCFHDHYPRLLVKLLWRAKTTFLDLEPGPSVYKDLSGSNHQLGRMNQEPQVGGWIRKMVFCFN